MPFEFIFYLLVTAATPSSSLPPPRTAVIPDDPLFARQVSFLDPGGAISFDVVNWRASPRTFECTAGIDLDVTRAWAITTGSRETIVALLDDGFFYAHEDVRENIWANPGETGRDAHGYDKATNGLDDDGDGYVDDVMGWDFRFGDPDPDGYVFDGMDPTRIQPYAHSTPAMGIIGAIGNNGIGVAGINWAVSMMLLKIGAQGIKRGEIDEARPRLAAEAIRYAADNGARVINWSGFVNDTRPESLAILKASIDYAEARGVLLVVGAGNFATDIDLEENFIYPQCFANDNILTVAEVDLTGRLDRASGRDHVSGSCYGVKNVDIAAIARNYSTEVRHGRSAYGLAGGTSNAAPVVTGVAALVLSVRPELDGLDVKRILMESARRLPSLDGRVGCGGIVDAYAAVRMAQRYEVGRDEDEPRPRRR
jgi:subtilisin family serine protease